MRVVVCADKQELGRRAATDGAAAIIAALAARGTANVILATGASQFEMLAALAAAPGIDWTRVECFHLDEYLGIPDSHPASFRKYLRERFVEKLPGKPKAFHYLDGQLDPVAECRRVGELLQQKPIDVAFIGIGENGHLAFNDPPADFQTTDPYLVVQLDDACRRQQHGEGWFKTFDEVPSRAISMSVRQILKSEQIICSVPDARKAQAVAAAVEGPVSPQVPASILQQHLKCTIYLDPPAAAQLKKTKA